MAQEWAWITLSEPPSLEELQSISKNPALQRVHLHSEASAINYWRETCLVITWDVLNLAPTRTREPTVIISSQVHIHRHHIVSMMREFTPWKLANTTNWGMFFSHHKPGIKLPVYHAQDKAHRFLCSFSIPSERLNQYPRTCDYCVAEIVTGF